MPEHSQKQRGNGEAAGQYPTRPRQSHGEASNANETENQKKQSATPDTKLWTIGMIGDHHPGEAQ